MKRLTPFALTLISVTLIAACGDDPAEPSAASEVDVSASAPEVSFTPENGTVTSAPDGPLRVDYRIIGQPVVGQPVAIDLRVSSSYGSQPVELSYQISDASAMRLADSQPQRISMSLSTIASENTQQVTIVPLREGRLYLNVNIAVATAEGSVSTVTAVPIQVGNAPRPVEENGVLTTDENGEAIRSLPATEN